MIITNRIEVLTKEEKIARLETKLMTMGLCGMAYSNYWNEIAKELNELKKENEPL